MKLLFLDIETAPHKVFSWGLFEQDIHIDQIVEPGYTLCWAAKWRGQRRVLFDSVHQSNPRDMVKRIHALIDEADAVCQYNGDKFDLPTLNKEFLLQGLSPPSPSKQIDLLRTARGQFRLASNKLDYVAGVLGLGSKVKHKGMTLWRDCMDGKPEAWRVMERYNKQDVVLLERVYDRLLPWVKGHPNMALFVDAKAPTCPNCGGKVQARGWAFTATNKYPRYQCRGCGKWSRGRGTVLDKERKASVLVAA